MKNNKHTYQPKDFERLYHDINTYAQQTTVSCDFCLDNIDVYIADKLAGHPVESAYPDLWSHLQACPDCMAAYQSLYEMSATPAVAEGFIETLPTKPALTPADLPFLKPPSADEPWYTCLHSQLSGGPFNLTFEFNLAYLQTLFLQPQPSTARNTAGYAAPEPQPLLHQIIAVCDQEFTVEVTYTLSADKADHLRLEATVMASDENSLPADLWASLTWTHQKREAPVTPQGYVDFGEVSLQHLKESVANGSGYFSINFTAKENFEC